MRVLTLHGRRQNADIFRDRLARVLRAVPDVDFVFGEGNVELPDGTRGWAFENGDFAAADSAVRELYMREGPFDVVLGFSEGAIIAARFAAEYPLRAGVFAGAPGAAAAGPCALQTLHFYSSSDESVPSGDSQAVAAYFKNSVVVSHPLGHCLPTRPDDVTALSRFLRGARELPMQGSPVIPEEQAEEMEALASIFGEDFEQRSEWPAACHIRLGPKHTWEVVLPPGYPSYQPRYCFSTSIWDTSDLEAATNAAFVDGEQCIFQMASAAQEWLEAQCCEDAPPGQVAHGDVEESDEQEEDTSAWWNLEDIDLSLVAAATEEAVSMPPIEARDAGASCYGRQWHFTIGLVGKPSAGKSTLFNAATKPPESKEASMAAHPFTTIDPNLGIARLAVPSPDGLGPEITLDVKDVAGLVPGAYLGRGRGNSFLSDLVDADALVHVVDASGSADRNGVAQAGGGDPLDDVTWVQQELHLWVFSNIRKKWAGLRRRVKAVQQAAQHGHVAAERLAGLLTGYQSSQALVMAVLEAAGFRIASLADLDDGLMGWGEREVHRLVAAFLRARFPVVLALNKADLPTSEANIERLRARNFSVVPVCARAEYWLVRRSELGEVLYDGGVPHTTTKASKETVAALQELRQRVFEPLGGTGVKEVFRAALSLRRPLYVYPVADAQTLAGLGSGPRAGSTGRLGTCVLLRQLSTMSDAFAALRHAGYVSGEFVRGEVIEDGVGSVKKKGDTLEGPTLVMRVVTKKQQWQKK